MPKVSATVTQRVGRMEEQIGEIARMMGALASDKTSEHRHEASAHVAAVEKHAANVNGSNVVLSIPVSARTGESTKKGLPYLTKVFREKVGDYWFSLAVWKAS